MCKLICNRLACGVPLTQDGIVLFIADLEIEAARLLDLCQQGGFHHEPRHPFAVDWKSYLLRRLDRIGMWRLVSPEHCNEAVHGGGSAAEESL